MFSKNVWLAKLAQVVYINSPTKISAFGLIKNEKSVKKKLTKMVGIAAFTDPFKWSPTFTYEPCERIVYPGI